MPTRFSRRAVAWSLTAPTIGYTNPTTLVDGFPVGARFTDWALGGAWFASAWRWTLFYGWPGLLATAATALICSEGDHWPNSYEK